MSTRSKARIVPVEKISNVSNDFESYYDDADSAVSYQSETSLQSHYDRVSISTATNLHTREKKSAPLSPKV